MLSSTASPLRTVISLTTLSQRSFQPTNVLWLQQAPLVHQQQFYCPPFPPTISTKTSPSSPTHHRLQILSPFLSPPLSPLIPSASLYLLAPLFKAVSLSTLSPARENTTGAYFPLLQMTHPVASGSTHLPSTVSSKQPTFPPALPSQPATHPPSMPYLTLFHKLMGLYGPRTTASLASSQVSISSPQHKPHYLPRQGLPKVGHPNANFLR